MWLLDCVVPSVTQLSDASFGAVSLSVSGSRLSIRHDHAVTIVRIDDDACARHVIVSHTRVSHINSTDAVYGRRRVCAVRFAKRVRCNCATRSLISTYAHSRHVRMHLCVVRLIAFDCFTAADFHIDAFGVSPRLRLLRRAQQRARLLHIAVQVFRVSGQR